MTYGCHNRYPYEPNYLAQDGWVFGDLGEARSLRVVEFRMAPECQYTKTELGQKDAGCNGCKHKEEN